MNPVSLLLLYSLNFICYLDELTIENGYAYLNSKTVWGSLRGLETFTQLLKSNDNIIVRIIHLFKVKDLFLVFDQWNKDH